MHWPLPNPHLLNAVRALYPKVQSLSRRYSSIAARDLLEELEGTSSRLREVGNGLKEAREMAAFRTVRLRCVQLGLELRNAEKEFGPEHQNAVLLEAHEWIAAVDKYCQTVGPAQAAVDV